MLRSDKVTSFAAIMLIFYLSVTQVVHINYLRHFEWAVDLFDKYSVARGYPLMHLMLKSLHETLSISNWKAYYFITLFFAYIVRLFLVRNYFTYISNNTWAVILAFSSIVIVAPFYDLGAHYQSFIQPNLIHSPTTIFTFPFSLFLYFYTVPRLDKLNKINLLKISAISIAVALSKPSYLLSYLPGLLIWFIFFERKTTLLKSKIRLFLYLSPLVITLALGAYIITSGYYKVGLKPFLVWKYYSNDSWVRGGGTILLSLIAPIYVLAKELQNKSKLSNSYVFSWIVFLISFSISLLFFDRNQMPAANFIQQLNIPMNILIIESAGVLFMKYKKDFFGFGLLALYLIYGLIFLYKSLDHSSFLKLFI